MQGSPIEWTSRHTSDALQRAPAAHCPFTHGSPSPGRFTQLPSKLPPALHAWARTQTVAQLEAWAAGAPPINLTPAPTLGGAAPGAPQGGVTEPTTQTLTLSAADLEVCSQLGIEPKTMLEQRKIELERARLGAAVGG